MDLEKKKFVNLYRRFCSFFVVSGALVFLTVIGSGCSGNDSGGTGADGDSTTTRTVSGISLAASPAILDADGVSTSTITATVTMSDGSISNGNTISFSLNGSGALSASSATTANRTATVTYTAGTTNETNTITATSGSVSANTTIVVRGVPGLITLTSVTTTGAVANGADSYTVTAQVLDAYNQPLNDQTVTFSVSNNTGMVLLNPPSSKTGSNGTATCTITEISSLDDNISISASSGNISSAGSLTLSFTGNATGSGTGPVPNSISLASVTTTGAVANGTDSYTVIAQVLDVFGQPLSDQTVIFSVSNNIGMVILNPPSSTTGSDGTVKCTITGISSQDDNIGISASSGDISSAGSLILSFIGNETGSGTGPSGLGQLGIAADSSVLADGVTEAIITVVLQDGDGSVIPDKSIVLATTGSAVISSANPTNTNSSGVANFTVTNTVAETVTLTASGEGASSVSVNQIFLPLIGSITATNVSPGTSVEAGSTIQVTFTVLNGLGFPVNNQAVTFEAISLSGKGAPTAYPSSAITNASGQATVTISDETAEQVTVRASALNVTGTQVLEFTEPPPANIIKYSTDPDPAVISISGVGSRESATLTFQLVDTNNNPVQGSHNVNFSILSGGLNGGEYLTKTQLSTVNALVSTVLNSGTKAGTLQVRASFEPDPDNNPGVYKNADVTVTITGGLPTGNAFGLSGKPLNIEGRDIYGLTQEIRVEAADFFSNPVTPGTQVQLQTDFAKVTGSAVFEEDDNVSAATVEVTTGTPEPTDGFVIVGAQTIGGIHSKVLTIAIDPNDEDIIYAGTDGGGIFKSMNAGTSWNQVGAPLKIIGAAKFANLTGSIVRDLVIDTNNSDVIYVGTDKGVFVSINGGENWSSLTGLRRITGDNIGTAAGTAFDAATGEGETFNFSFENSGVRSRTKIYVNGVETTSYDFLVYGIQFFGAPGASLAAGAVISADYDASSSMSEKPVYSIAVNPDPAKFDISVGHGLEIYAGTYGDGVWKTVNGGRSWSKVSTMAAGQSVSFGENVLSLTINELNTAEIFVGTDGNGLFKSTNSATTWVKLTGTVAAQLNETEVRDVTIVSLAPNANNIWVAGKNGIHYSADGGATWNSPATDVNAVDVTNTDVRVIKRDSNDGTLYAATYGDVLDKSAPHGGIYRSTDGGVNWSILSDIAQTGRAHALDSLAVFGKIGDDTLIVGSEGRSVSRSTDSGATWARINGTAPTNLTNTLYNAMKLMHSGETLVYIIPLTATYQPMDDYTAATPGYGSFNTIYNTEDHEFYIRVSDDLGHRLTPDTKISITATKGTLFGPISKTLVDGVYGNTDYYISWRNDITGDEPVDATMTVSVTSDNGNVEEKIDRNLIGVLTPSVDSITISVVSTAAAGTTATEQVTATGGSDTGYSYSVIAGGTAGGTISVLGVYTYTYPGGLSAGEKRFDTIVITDDATGETEEIPVTVTIK